MSLKIITYFESVAFDRLNHEHEYNIIKSASSYEECFEFAVSYDAVIIMQIANPVYRVQDIFSTFENYEALPDMLAFFEVSPDTLVYAISSKAESGDELQSVFIRFFEQSYQNIMEYSFYCSIPETLSHGLLTSRTMLLERSEFLTDILRGVTKQEFADFREKMCLKLGDDGYYLYVWFLRAVQGNDYYHHSKIKNLYDLIGDLLIHECEEILARYRGGEVFYVDTRMLCMIINDPEPCRANKRIAGTKLKELTAELNQATGCGDAHRCMSGYIKDIERVRSAYDGLYELKQYYFFCRDNILITEDSIRQARATTDMDAINVILRDIRHMLTYDVNNPELITLVQALFLVRVKRSLDYRLFFYCYFNLSSFLYQKITNSFETPPPHWMETDIDIQRSNIEIKCGNIISAIGLIQSSSSSYVSHIKNTLVEKAIKYILKNYMESISLITLSQHLNISSVYLSQLFKKELGTSPVKFIINYRIEKAKELLQQTDDAVNNISIKVGFTDSKHFSKTFKRVTGLTPMQYRKER